MIPTGNRLKSSSMAVKAIVAAYFNGELEIPNITGSSNVEVENLAALSWMIKKHEPKFIHGLLGDNLYALYAAAIASTPAITSGIYFDLNAQIYIEDATNHLYQSSAANYVYFRFWRNNQTQTLSTGGAKAKIENADAISMNGKMIEAWNEMSEKVNEIRQWIEDHITDYPTYTTEGQEDYSPLTPFF